MPEQTQNGLSVRVLLNPSLKIGQVFQLVDTDINQLRLDPGFEADRQNRLLQQSSAKLNGQGYYYVMVANHSGDTRGNPWYTDMTCLAVDATIPASALAQTAVNGAVRRW